MFFNQFNNDETAVKLHFTTYLEIYAELLDDASHRRSQGVPLQGVQWHPQDTKCTPSQGKSQFFGQFMLGGLDWRYI